MGGSMRTVAAAVFETTFWTQRLQEIAVGQYFMNVELDGYDAAYPDRDQRAVWMMTKDSTGARLCVVVKSGYARQPGAGYVTVPVGYSSLLKYCSNPTCRVFESVEMVLR